MPCFKVAPESYLFSPVPTSDEYGTCLCEGSSLIKFSSSMGNIECNKISCGKNSRGNYEAMKVKAAAFWKKKKEQEEKKDTIKAYV